MKDEESGLRCSNEGNPVTMQGAGDDSTRMDKSPVSKTVAAQEAHRRDERMHHLTQ